MSLLVKRVSVLFFWPIFLRNSVSPATQDLMLPETAAALISEHDANSSWTSTFWFPTFHGDVDLLPGTGDTPKCLPCHPYQPHIYPSGTSYRFDPSKYCGTGSAPNLLEDLSSSLGDSFFYSRGTYQSSAYTTYYLRCSFNDVTANYSDDTFVPDSFIKKDTKTEPIKRHRVKKNLPTDRMPSAKLKEKRENGTTRTSPNSMTKHQAIR